MFITHSSAQHMQDLTKGGSIIMMVMHTTAWGHSSSSDGLERDTITGTRRLIRGLPCAASWSK